MSHCSFAQAYHPNCLADYEKLQHKMDHYQTHTHPLPTPPHTTSIHTTTSWVPNLHWPTLPHNPSANHHFHFPAISIHDLSTKWDNIGNSAPTPSWIPPTAATATIVPWVPDADIRETKHAYHIEIEVPGVTDQKAMTIQWLERRTLLVRGEIRRPDLDHADASQNAEAETQTKADEQEGTPDAAAGKVAEADASVIPIAAAPTPAEVAAVTETNTKPDSTGPPSTPWEKLDLDWCTLTKTHEDNNLTNGNKLQRVLSSAEQESAREGESSGERPSSVSAAATKTTFLLSERKVGMWQRTFTLPLDADMKKLTANLRGGLLVVKLPKRSMEGGKGWEISIGQ